MNWLAYLLEANINLAIFYALYKFILSRETFYSLNRFYLLFTGIAAFILPFFRLSSLQFSSSEQVYPVQANYSEIPVDAHSIEQTPSFWTLDTVLLTLYFTVCAFMLMRFFYSLYQLSSLVKRFKVKKQNGLNLVNLSDQKASFSFFNYVFVDLNSADADTIIKHETAHSKQYHSIDVLIFELIHIINWFNPLIIYLKKDVKALHEFSADAATLNENLDEKTYSLFLIHNSSISAQQNLASQMFDSRLLKKRINMMYRDRSVGIARSKYLLLIPLILILICVSSFTYTKSYGIDLSFKKADDHVLKNEHMINVMRKQQVNMVPEASGRAVISGERKSNKSLRSAEILSTKQYPVLNIDGRTDTVKIRLSDTTYSQMYKGIYIIGDKIYEEKQLREALKQSANKLDIVLKTSPEVGYHTPDDANAIKQWGARAKNGVIFALSRHVVPDTLTH